ncbi:MAG TPA: hypothetical protein EYQ81_12500 [Sneathiellales bacterium]|jgi:uncharacterized protein (DUF1330 family)|nr:hypothetical protein [Sneathiellales bacterium]
MAIVNPTPETFKTFMKTDYDNGPIVGINFLRDPSRDAFIEMQKSPTYQAVLTHRTAGLADTRLVFVSPGEIFK